MIGQRGKESEVGTPQENHQLLEKSHHSRVTVNINRNGYAFIIYRNNYIIVVFIPTEMCCRGGEKGDRKDRKSCYKLTLNIYR